MIRSKTIDARPTLPGLVVDHQSSDDTPLEPTMHPWTHPLCRDSYLDSPVSGFPNAWVREGIVVPVGHDIEELGAHLKTLQEDIARREPRRIIRPPESKP